MMSERSPIAAMTWLEAAEHILRLEGPEMHIRDLTDRVMNLHMVNSSCKTSLETLLYRQTHKINSKFQRVPGKMGWFRLKNNSDHDSSSKHSLTPSMDEDELMPKAIIVRPRSSHKRHCISPSQEESDISESTDSDDDEDDDDDQVWVKKYHYLKLLAKRMITVNTSLALQLEQLQADIEQGQLEKSYLFQRLLDLQSQETKPVPPTKPVTKTVEQQQQSSTTTVATKLKKSHLSPKTTSTTSSSQPKPTAAPERLIYNAITEPSDLFSTSPSNSDEELSGQGVKNKSGAEKKEGGGAGGGTGRKKRVRRLQPISLKDDGSPVFPIKLGGLQVLYLGEIVCDRPAFHNERYIWPIGFKSTRSYPSMVEPSRRCLYTCRIIDGGDGPIFQMVSEENPDVPIQASSATACHHAVLKAINKARDKQATNAGSGPEFFGFSHPSILNLIQALPGADKCTKYKPTQFQQPLLRGKQTTSQPSTKPKNKTKSFSKSQSPVGDPSLAPVVLNTQLSSLQDSSSSLSSECSDSDSNLIIDQTR